MNLCRNAYRENIQEEEQKISHVDFATWIIQGNTLISFREFRRLSKIKKYFGIIQTLHGSDFPHEFVPKRISREHPRRGTKTIKRQFCYMDSK